MRLFPTRCGARAAALAALLLPITACSSFPTLESIKYGYSPSQISAVTEEPGVDDANDVAAGWAPEAGLQSGAQPVLYGRDGTPVGASQPGTVTTTTGPINDGVSVEGAAGGSRSHLFDLYSEAVEERDELQDANEDLQIALEMSETRASDLSVQLASLRAEFDALGKDKQSADAQAFDLAARLATAQIARLEAERALLEATIEWRRMSENNNRSLAASGENP